VIQAKRKHLLSGVREQDKCTLVDLEHRVLTPLPFFYALRRQVEII
jgi:hypothetical protein